MHGMHSGRGSAWDDRAGRERASGTIGPLREELGRTAEGRPIDAWRVGDPSAELRVVVIAGQHGDEPWGREAVRRWLALRVAARDPALSERRLAVAAIPDANPDGSARSSRKNSRGQDLNRDHFLLRTEETRALHGFLRAYRPHLVIDVHNYPPRRRHLLARGWEIDPEIQVGTPTHPAVRTAIGEGEFAELYSTLRTSLARSGTSFARYTIFRESGRARPGTQRVVDARNGIALRLGIPTVLLEGRDPGSRGTETDAERTVNAQMQALDAIVGWALDHAAALVRGPPVPQAGDAVPIATVWRPGSEPTEFVFRRTRTGDRVSVEWPGAVSRVAVRVAVTLPRAYAVRADRVDLLRALERQGFEAERPEAGREALVDAPRRDAALGGPSAAALEASDPVDLTGFVVYSVHQRGGHALAVWLEPESRFGFARAGLLGGASDTGRPPEVLRVVAWRSRASSDPTASRGLPSDVPDASASSGPTLTNGVVSSSPSLDELVLPRFAPASEMLDPY